MSSSETTVSQHVEAPYYVKALAMGLPAVMLGLQISGWIFFVASITHGHPDFRANYTAGYMARTGELHRLYDYETIKRVQDRLISQEVVGMPFIHPAYEAILYIPVSLLPFRAAYVAFLAINLALLLLSFFLLKFQTRNLKELWRPLPIAVFLTYLPIAAALMQGQDSIILLTLCVVSFAFLERGKETAAGLWLGLGAFRFQLVLPIALLFLIWKRWRFLIGIALSGIAALAVSVWMVGLEATKLYVRSLASMSIGNMSEIERLRYAQPVGYMGNLRALISGVAAHWLPSSLVQAIIVVLSIAILIWVAHSAEPAKTCSDLLLIAIPTAAIVSYHMFIHDMSVLALPTIIILNRFIWAESEQDRTARWMLRSAALMFAAPATIVLAPLPFYLVCLATMAFVVTLLKTRADLQYSQVLKATVTGQQ